MLMFPANSWMPGLEPVNLQKRAGKIGAGRRHMLICSEVGTVFICSNQSTQVENLSTFGCALAVIESFKKQRRQDVDSSHHSLECGER